MDSLASRVGYIDWVIANGRLARYADDMLKESVERNIGIMRKTISE